VAKVPNCRKYCGLDVTLSLCYSCPNKMSMATDMMAGLTWVWVLRPEIMLREVSFCF
jgi:hypothetical protein